MGAISSMLLVCLGPQQGFDIIGVCYLLLLLWVCYFGQKGILSSNKLTSTHCFPWRLMLFLLFLV